MNFYNEIDPFAAAWLRELIKAGHITPGVVDERSIEDITPNELTQYTQCHFFAGIGVWSYALRRAGWSDDRPVWTGSCPCQPFSTSSKRSGTSDERHLWPSWFHLIRECRPKVIFGEQVEAAIRFGWFDLVHDDLEGIGYTFGAASINAAGFGAPHIRQRLYFMAHSTNVRCEQQWEAATAALQGTSTERGWKQTEHGHEGELSGRHEGLRGPSSLSLSHCAVEHAERDGLQGRLSRRTHEKREIEHGPVGCDGATRGFWSGADFVYCRDGFYRPVESGTFPLVNGSPAGVGRLRGYGNAIVAPVAEAFIKAAMEAIK